MSECPLPLRHDRQIVLGHGGGGRMSAELVRDVFQKAFSDPALTALDDSAIVAMPPGRLAITTDAFVVRPLFFPGGDIGKLAVCGTLNDLAVSGAEPRYLSAAFILEEGLAIADLERIVASMQAECVRAHVAIVAGDTKVVDRGKGDQVFIAMTGIGVVHGAPLALRDARAGDQVLVSGPIGDHGIAVMAARENIETDLQSDCASVVETVRALLASGAEVRGMRDPTRGGLATVLNELAAAAHVCVKIDERAVPVRPAVRAVCELLGLDPFYVACEGRVVIVVAPSSVDRALAALGGQAARIGEIVSAPAGIVALRSIAGGERIMPLLAGEQLPRIC